MNFIDTVRRLAAATPPAIGHHPYYPPHVEIPFYVANETPIPVLLGAFGSLLAIVLMTALTLATRANPDLGRQGRLVFCWFVLCGSLHCFFEGYFVLNHADLAGSQSLFAQLWKEYALSDSRYLTSDPFMLCVETITVLVWGPCCFMTAVSIARSPSSSLRYPLQIVVSIAHLYGVALYYGTCFAETRFNGVSHSRPEFLYYWVYYVGMNAPWVVVPIVLLSSSIQGIRAKDRTLRDMDVLLRKSSLVHSEPLESRKTK